MLRVPSALFGAGVLLRRAAYDAGLAPVARLPVPVISVGNLSVGGTGKTPMCAWIVRELQRRGRRPGLLSRGYRAGPDGRNEEALLLERLCPGVLHVQDPDRVRGGRELAGRGVDVVVLDDGFQHRRLFRDLDLVLVDATRPWGLPGPVRALLPRGFLREPISSLARADAIVLTRCSQADEAALGALEREIGAVAPGRPVVRAEHRAVRLRAATGGERPLSMIAGCEVDLASGIGNPEAFEASVRAAGAIVREHRAFADHHRYVAGDLAGLGQDGRPLVTTQKDAVKLAELDVGFVALEVELALTRGAAVLDALLDAVPLEGARE